MKFIAFIYRHLLRLRYKIEIKGTDVLLNSYPKFILPNHQALIDPQIIFTYLSKYISVVPIVTENFASLPILKSIFKALDAVVVSDLSSKNRDTNVLDTINIKITEALKNRKNVLLYPSGQIAGQGYERIFNKLGAWTVVKNMPEGTRIIGVRINGLWGSMWSRAWTGNSPVFFKTYFYGLFYVLANFIFFIPKRKVSVEFFDITKEAVKNAKEDKMIFNKFLEDFYNINGEEPLTYLKHYFFTPKLIKHLPEKIVGSVADTENVDYSEKPEISKEVLNSVIKIIAETAKLNENEIKRNSNLNLDLNIDSITLVAIVTELEQRFSVAVQVEVNDIKSVEDLCAIASGLGKNIEKLKPSHLSTNPFPLIRIEIDNSKNIVEACLAVCASRKSEYFLYDKMLGTTTRKDFLLKAFVVSEIIKKEVEGKYLGIMLPAIQSTTLLVISSFLAGKIPVMLNWTVGKKVMEHCVESSQVEVILTAKSFYDKIEDLLPESLKHKTIFFEQKVKETGIWTKFKGLSRFFFKIIPRISCDQVAVILFTSGSEAFPKAVPLTHSNIMSNMHAVFSMITMYSDRVFLGFLPPFHSFGFTVLTVLPLVSVCKVAYTPDPTDKREVLKILKHSKSNTIVGTPTFIKMMLSVSTRNDLKNIDIALTGAESLPSSLIKMFNDTAGENAKLLEGYGITECSPIITINPLDRQKERSVGKFLPGIEYLITDINTYVPLEKGKEGMIMVKGKSVFGGYADKSIESPFIKINNFHYYKTGDLGFVDDEDYLFLTGRLKQFIKIAGEMISLPAIENTLLLKYGSEEKVTLAIEGKDTISPPQIVLFSVINIDKNEVNLYLKENGFSNLVKVTKIIQIDEIPLLGTGKTDYKVLRELINN